MLKESPTINWALIMVHNCFSFNLLTMGIIFLSLLLRKSRHLTSILLFGLAIGLFWLFSALHQLVTPMPLPARLDWLSVVLIGVAILNAIVILVPLYLTYKTRYDPHL